MIRHLIRLTWNRKRSLIWIFIEQVLVFGVLLFCFTSVVDVVTRYYSKGRLRVDQVVRVSYNISTEEEIDGEACAKQFFRLVESMKQWPCVEYVSMSLYGALPVIGNSFSDSIKFRERSESALIKFCDESYYHIFMPKLSEGKWFRDIDVSDEIPPAVITQRLVDNSGFTGSAIGQTIQYRNRDYRIVGVMEAYKDRDAEMDSPVLFIPVSDDIEDDWEYIVRYKPGMQKEFTKAYLDAFYKEFPRDKFMPGLMDISKFRTLINFFYLSEVYLLGIPTAFLVIFAFLGTFGLVWMQSKKRMGELGLRMALGSTPGRLQRTIIMENLMLTTLAMLPGFIVAVNLYAFAPKGWEWITAVGAAIILMWLFSAFSAWYPARQAAKVQPVEALRSNQ